MLRECVSFFRQFNLVLAEKEQIVVSPSVGERNRRERKKISSDTVDKQRNKSQIHLIKCVDLNEQFEPIAETTIMLHYSVNAKWFMSFVCVCMQFNRQQVTNIHYIDHLNIRTSAPQSESASMCVLGNEYVRDHTNTINTCNLKLRFFRCQSQLAVFFHSK